MASHGGSFCSYGGYGSSDSSDDDICDEECIPVRDLAKATEGSTSSGRSMTQDGGSSRPNSKRNLKKPEVIDLLELSSSSDGGLSDDGSSRFNTRAPSRSTGNSTKRTGT